MNLSPLKIVCLGDSTTAGTPGFFSPRERPPEGQGNPESQYAFWMLQRFPEWQVFNKGVRGQRTDQMLRRFKWDVMAHQPHIVIVLGGVNDIHQGKPIHEIQENLTNIYEAVCDAPAKVLACTLLPLNILTAAQKEQMAVMNRWICQIANKNKFLFCDTYRVVENPDKPGYLVGSPDEIHPDVEGYKRLGYAIAEKIFAFTKNSPGV